MLVVGEPVAEGLVDRHHGGRLGRQLIGGDHAGSPCIDDRHDLGSGKQVGDRRRQGVEGGVEAGKRDRAVELIVAVGVGGDRDLDDVGPELGFEPWQLGQRSADATELSRPDERDEVLPGRAAGFEVDDDDLLGFAFFTEVDFENGSGVTPTTTGNRLGNVDVPEGEVAVGLGHVCRVGGVVGGHMHGSFTRERGLGDVDV